MPDPVPSKAVGLALNLIVYTYLLKINLSEALVNVYFLEKSHLNKYLKLQMVAWLAENACELRSDMPKGKKRMRGEPVYHDELKQRLNLTVTPTGARGLEEIAQELGLKSKSELVDQIGRRIFLVSPNSAVKQDIEEPAD